MTTQYPAQIDSSITLPSASDNITPVTGELFNTLRDAIVRVEATLGINPASSFGTVSARLKAIEGGGGGGGGGTNFVANGDLSGTATLQTVIGLQNIPVIDTVPINGQVLEFNGGEWAPYSISNIFTAGGDLSGSGTNQTVSKINGTSVPSGPAVNSVLVALSGTTATWEQISNAQVSSTAAIAGTKITPNFGSQNISTTGTLGAGTSTLGATNVSSLQDTALSSGVVHADSSGNFTSSLVINSDVSSSASISVSKLSSGTAAQVLLNNSTPTPAWTSISGDVSLTNSGATTVEALQGHAVENVSPTDGYVLTWNAGASQWQPEAISSGSVTLDGDVTGAATSNTVGKINGSSVPAGGSLTTGNTLYVSGASSLSYGSLNLAGGANYVTGALPTANQVAQTMSGDVSGTTAASTVTAIQGNAIQSTGALTSQQDGYVLTWRNSDGYWVPESNTAAASGGWVDSAMGTFDWRNQTTQTLGSDITYSIGGQAWTKINSSNDATPMQVTNGVGLTITPKSGTQFLNDNRTAPALLLQLSSIIPNFGPDTPIQIWGYWTAQNPSANYDEAFIGIDSGPNLPQGWRAGIAYNTPGGGTLGQQLAWDVNAEATGNYEQTSAGTSDVVECLTLPQGVATQAAVLGSSATPYSADTWPDITVRCVVDGGSFAANANWPLSNGFYACFGAQRIGSGTNFVATLAAIRIRYQGVSGASIALIDLSGDVTGPTSSTTVQALQGHAITSGTLGSSQDGYVLTWDNTDGYWKPAKPASGFTAGGDLSGSGTSQTVIGLDNTPLSITSLTTGNSLHYNGTDWVNSAVNLAGGSAYVTGSLPTANQVAQSLTLTGDVSSSGGTTASATTTVTAMQGYAIENVAPTDGYVLTWHNSASQWQPTAISSGSVTLSGDVSGAASSNTVGKIQGNTVTSGALVNGDLLIASSTSNWAGTAVSGDVSFSTSTPGSTTVKALQGNSVESGTLGSTQDGYALIWRNSASQWKPLPLSAATGATTPRSGTASNRGSATGSGAIYFCTDIPIAYFDNPNTSTWQQFGPINALTAPPASGNYTVTGSLSLTYFADSIRALATTNTAGCYTALTAGTLTQTSQWYVSLSGSYLPYSNVAYPQIGVCVSTGTTTSATAYALAIDVYGGSGSNLPYCLVNTFHPSETRLTDPLAEQMQAFTWFNSNLFNFRLLNDGTNLHYQVSIDNFNWTDVFSSSTPSSLTDYGFYLGSDGGSYAYGMANIYSNVLGTPSTYTVTAATNASPSVVTIGSHSILPGDVVAIHGMLGNTGPNTSNGTGSLAGGNLVTAVTSTTITTTANGNGAWTSGGVVTVLSR